MADLKISELATESPIVGTESVEIVTGGINKKTTTQAIANLAAGTSIPYGATSGTNTYTIAATPAVAAYVDAMLLHVRIGNSSTGAVTFNFNGLGAKKVLDTAGFQAADGYLKAGVDYIISYNSALDSAVGAFVVVNELMHGLMNLRGVYAASGGLYPGSGGSGPSGDVRHGDTWVVSGTDTVGSIVLRAGDMITTAVDNPGQTASNWYVIPGYASVDLKLSVTTFAKYIVDQVSTSTAGDITLDMNSQVQRSHVGSATFAAAKAIALSNTTNSLFFNFIFEVTSVAAVLTFPGDWLSASSDFNGTAWTPPDTGKFEFGGSFDDTNNAWYIKISGPFT